MAIKTQIHEKWNQRKWRFIDFENGSISAYCEIKFVGVVRLE